MSGMLTLTRKTTILSKDEISSWVNLLSSVSKYQSNGLDREYKINVGLNLREYIDIKFEF